MIETLASTKTKLSRVLRELDVARTHPVKFDSTFHDYGSPYRGPPGPETDTVWENEAGAACKRDTFTSTADILLRCLY